jgi:hypothetical protein
MPSTRRCHELHEIYRRLVSEKEMFDRNIFPEILNISFDALSYLSLRL